MKVLKIKKEESKQPLPIFQISITLLDNEIETIDNVIRIEPINGLLVMVLKTGETIVYPVVSIKKYSFKGIK